MSLVEKRDYVLDEIFKYGVDVKERTIYFGEVDDSKADDDNFGDVCFSSIEYIIRKFNKFIAEDTTKPIHFWMSSRGGDVYDMLRLCDRIESCPCPVYFYGSGRIMSAATWIMSVCDVRSVFKNSRILLHDGSTGINGKYTDVLIDVKEEEELSEILAKMFANNTFINDKDFWIDFLQRDVVLTPEQAFEIGLVDRIIEPIDRTEFRVDRIKNQPNDEKISNIIKDLYIKTKRNPEKIVVTPVNNINHGLVEQLIATTPKKRGRKPKV